MPSTPHKYDIATRLLHWSQALLIFGLAALGWWMTGLTYYDRWYNDALFWHRAVGLLILVTAASQLLWRWLRSSPPPAVSGFDLQASRAVHRLFLLLMLLVPMSGYLISTSAGAAIPLPGGVNLPALARVGEGLREVAISAHYWLAYGTIALAAVHAAAALKHHFISRDDVLRRML